VKILVTGGAGFIGRWVVKQLLAEGHEVVALDNLSNGSRENIAEFKETPNFNFVEGDIKDNQGLKHLFDLHSFEICYHLGASINVQDSIDDPRTTFDNDVIGSFNVLEQARCKGTRVVFVSTCMVYDRCHDSVGITEQHPSKPASPYAASKIAGEGLALSYHYAYGLPVTVVRPFNTYGPFQKSSGEGGVVAIFIKQKLTGANLKIYGDGNQTRDLLFVEDCARFITAAGFSDKAVGEILNGGLGSDITINELASLIVGDKERIKHVPHIHPQSEIPKLLCNYNKAKKLLNWEPRIGLDEGIKITQMWIQKQLENPNNSGVD
jgi:nucleoside-diphosphate-sugar epimerase